jgi:sigma54-dependent transcription regulator
LLTGISTEESICGVAATNASVVVTGETGTGTELAARAIHARSPRRGRPLLAINCAAAPDSLIESDRSGHERGTFTGADRRRDGPARSAMRDMVRPLIGFAHGPGRCAARPLMGLTLPPPAGYM